MFAAMIIFAAIVMGLEALPVIRLLSILAFFAIGMIVATRVMLREDLSFRYQGTNPASAAMAGMKIELDEKYPQLYGKQCDNVSGKV